MAEAIWIENIGCVVAVSYSYLQVTLDEIAAWKAVGIYHPTALYRAWDVRNRALISDGRETVAINFDIVDNGAGEAQTVYNFPELIEGVVLSVSVEGQGLNEEDLTQVNIDMETGNVSLPNAIIGQYVKILYK